MRIDKVIMRSVFSTLLAIVILIALLFCLLCWVFPSTMMEFTYKMGMDGESMKYAMRAYNGTGAVEYVAFATETAIGTDQDSRIEEYGLQLIADDEFLMYCEKRNQKLDTANVTYNQYVYAMVSLAQYRQAKTAEAIQTAFDALDEGFPKNNAVVGLLTTAIGKGDGDTVTSIKTRLQALTITGEADQAYLAEVLAY